MPLFTVQAVLFDLDGVLVDSTGSVGRVWGRWAKAHRLDAARVIQTAHGQRTVETVAMVAPHLDAAAETAQIEQWEIEDSADTRAFAGAQALLASLPADRWAIATSGTRQLATARIRAAGLPLPVVLVTADDVRQGKPHPEPYLKAAAGLARSPREAMVIEDAPSGIEAGKAAGCRVLGVPTTYPAAALAQADAVLARLADLTVSVQDGHLRLVIP